MPKVYVEVEGIKEVIAGFKAMGEDGKKALHEAVNIGAEILAPIIRENTPVGTSDNVRLKDNISIDKAKPKKTTKQTALIKIGGKKGADYAIHVEVGHRTKNGKTIPAHPFIRPAVDKSSDEVAIKVASHILDRIGV